MDKLLEVTPYPISLSIEPHRGFYSKTLISPASNAEARSRRGNLFLALTSHTSLVEFDLLSFSDQLLNKLWQDYFNQSIGSIPDALTKVGEEVTAQAVQAKADISLAVCVIWGEIMISKTWGSGRVFLEGKNETLEFSGENVHQEQVNNNDKIILLTVSSGEEVRAEDLHILLRVQDVSAAVSKFKESLSTAENPSRLGLLLLDLKMVDVPSEEEKIVILETPDGNREPILNKLKSIFSPFVSTVSSFPSKLLKGHKNLGQPPIYLRSHLPSGKKGKLFLVLVLVLFLILGVFLSRVIGQRNQQQALGEKLLSEAEAAIGEARDSASLDAEKTQALLNDAQDNLSRVKGLRVEKDQAQRIDRLLQEAIKDLYKVVEVEARSSTSNLPSNGFSVDLRSGVSRVIEGEERIIIDPSSDWVKIFGLKEYLGNIYLLDTGASQIWKYLSLGSSFSKNFPYFKEEVDLIDVSDWAIDGSIFLLRKDAALEKFVSGKKVDFRLAGLYAKMTGTIHLFTDSENENIYLYQSNKIYIFNKDGFYVKQLQVNNLQAIDELFVLEKSKTAWLKSDQQVHQISLP